MFHEQRLKDKEENWPFEQSSMSTCRHLAHRQLGLSLQDFADALHLFVELAPLPRGQPPERFHCEASVRPERRWCQTPATVPLMSNTGKAPAWPPDSARSAARPGKTFSRG